MDFAKSSLKEECLCVIAEYFEQYFAAFEVCEGTVFKKQFQFLAKFYSEVLFQELLFTDQLKAKYFKILINRHVKQLKLVGIKEELLPPLVKQLRAIENNVESLRVGFWNVEPDDFKQLISSVPKVEVIHISGVLYPEVMAEIGRKCSLVRELKFSDYDFDDCGLMNIFLDANGWSYENKPSLQLLEIPPSVESKVVCFILDHAPSLKQLNYVDLTTVLYEKHKRDLADNTIEASKKYSLTTLCFPAWNENVLDMLKICTTVCPNVSSVTINCIQNDEQLLLLSRFHHLQDLKIYINRTAFSFETISHFLKLSGKNLLSIELENGCISAEAIIEHCPKLNSLKLSKVCFKPLDEKNRLFSKAKLCNLKTLAMKDSDFSIKDTADSLKLIISNCRNVRSVDFSEGQGLTDGFLLCVSQLGLFQVKELNLDSSDATVAAVAELLVHGNLTTLRISRCTNITEAEYYQLLECRGDKDITITNGEEWKYSLNDNEDDYSSTEGIDYDDDTDYDDDDGYGFDDDFEDFHGYYDCDTYDDDYDCFFP